jgi:purine-binding chemotaxis protein CheW
VSALAIGPGGSATELARAFDDAFAAPPEGRRTEMVELVEVSVGNAPHAIRLSEIRSLFADIRVTPCPGPLPEMLGLAAFRGVLVPVYDLAALLGRAPAQSPRLFALARPEPVALAFDGFGGHFRIAKTEIAGRQRSADEPVIDADVRRDGRTLPVLALAALLAGLRARSDVHTARDVVP